MRRLLLLAPALAAALALGCGADDPPAAAQAQPMPETAAPKAPKARTGITVTTRRSRFGRVLFDGRGRVFYLFTKEKTKRAECYGACADAWPPVLTKGRPKARGAAKQRLIGTTTRRDGSTQVTYGGVPMYYYVGDREPGQILCHNVIEFGGTWLVVQPSGKAAPA